MKYLITEEQLVSIADGIQRLLTSLLKDKRYIYKVTAEPIADEDYEDESIEIYLIFDMDKLLGVNDTNKHILRVRAQRIAREYVEKFFPSIEFGIYTRAKSNRD
jgi:hypothetical protein